MTDQPLHDEGSVPHMLSSPHSVDSHGDLENPNDSRDIVETPSYPSVGNLFDEPNEPSRERIRAYEDSTTAFVSAAAAAGAAAAVAASTHNTSTAERSHTPRTSRSKSLCSPESTTTSRTVSTEGSQSPGNNSSVVTVEHKVKQSGSSGKRSIAKLKKPMLALIVLLTTGGMAFFFTKWLSIPGLTDQIDRLEEQVDELEKQVDRLEAQVDRLSAEVDRLDSEVDRLSEENDRFARLNEELAANLAEYEDLNAALRNTTERYEELNAQLNASNVELERLNGELREQNERYEELNDNLNTTVLALQEEVSVLENVTINLTQTNVELRESVVLLTDQVDTLQAENEFLNNTVFALDQEVDALTNETERLAELNANLANIVSFLNETASGIDESYNAISEFLAEQITAYRGYVMDTLKNLYMQRVTNWDCDFRSFFLTQPFVRDPTLPVGSTAYPEVRDYVEERILSELCLDTSDFEQFLQAEFVQNGQALPVNVTTNQLRRSVQVYTRTALSYYFPSSNNAPINGPNNTDWAMADYNCENLPSNKRFLVYS